MRPGGFGFFGPRRPRDPERSRRTSRILLIAGAVLALATVIQFVIVSRGSKPAPATHQCELPKGATPGTETPAGNLPKLFAPLGPPDLTFTQHKNGETAYVFCYNRVSEDQAQAAQAYIVGLGYRASGNSGPQQASYTAPDAQPYGISLFVTEGLDLEHAGTGSGGLAVTWVDEEPP